MPLPHVTFREALWVWIKIAILSFGGPSGQIAVMHRILVEEKRWITEGRFLHALNYCMLLPGPEAQQLVTYAGWLFHKTIGGLVAGSLFVLPGFVSILILSILYAGYQETSFVAALFYGLKPAVMAVVVEALIRIGRRTLKNGIMVGLATAAFVAIFFFEIPFPLIILGAGLIGYLGGKVWTDKFYLTKRSSSQPSGSSSQNRPSFISSLRVAALWSAIWLVPLIVLMIILGMNNVFVREGIFFSKTAVVTFGGAYAVLAYIAQQAVNTYGWLQPGEMLDGLGMAETTPGPLIQVVQFVGFMGAYRNPGLLDPMLAGVLGSILTTWMTFAPCFLWIFLGAPYIEYLRDNKSLGTALSGITAAVVGVVFNLAVWFSLHTLFASVTEAHKGSLRLLIPSWATLDFVSLLISVGAFIALFRFKMNMIITLASAALVGILYHLSFGG